MPTYLQIQPVNGLRRLLESLKRLTSNLGGQPARWHNRKISGFAKERDRYRLKRPVLLPSRTSISPLAK